MKTLYAPETAVFQELPQEDLRDYLANLEDYQAHKTTSLFIPIAVDEDGGEYRGISFLSGYNDFYQEDNLHVASGFFRFNLTAYIEDLKEALEDGAPELTEPLFDL